MSTAYILDGFELFFTDLAKKQVFDNHTFKGQGAFNLQILAFYIFQIVQSSGMKKTVFICLTAEDKAVLLEASRSLESNEDRQLQCWEQWPLVQDKILYGVPLWWKRRSFNHQDLKEPESSVTVRGVRPLSDDDQSSVKYRSKLHVSSSLYRIETM